MALGPGQVARLGPAPVAVHHDRHVPGQPVGGDAPAAGRRSHAARGGAGADDRPARVALRRVTLAMSGTIPRCRPTATKPWCCAPTSSARRTGSSPCCPGSAARSARWPRGYAGPPRSSAPGWSRSPMSTCSSPSGRTLDVVTQVESLHAFGEPLTSDYPAYTAGQVMLETADRLVVEEGEPAVQQYLLLVGALRRAQPRHRRRARPADDDLGLLPAAGARGGRLRAVLRRLRPLRSGRPAPGVLPGRRGRGLRALPARRVGPTGAGDAATCSAPCSRVAGPTPGT